MDKEKQIEEIAKVLNECCNRYDEQGRHLGNKCSNCEYWCDTNHICCSYNIKEAETLYEQGYRKINENEVVISKEELERLKQEQTKSYTAIINSSFLDRIEQLENRLIKARKETAREILQIIKQEYDYIGDLERIIAKKYGVEIGEENE